MSGYEGAVSYLKNYKGRKITVMEVCGTHTAAAFKGGIRSILSPDIRLISGPGCPVCLASAAYIDRLCELAADEATIVASFGDLLKVKGTKGSLNDAKASGGHVIMVYSPLDALRIAEENPDKTVIMAAIGFETTAPLYALLIKSALEQGVENLMLLTALKRMPPALNMLCAEDIDAFLAPGHVAAIIGSDAFLPLAKRFLKPFAVAGFTPEGMLAALYSLVKQVEKGEASVVNLYGEVVRPKGNEKALAAIREYFTTGPAFWRGIAGIRYSGLYLKEKYSRFDAGSQGLVDERESALGCHCAEVLTGRLDPDGCPLFGKACTPDNAHGPCMVSAEGACGIWYREGRSC